MEHGIPKLSGRRKLLVVLLYYSGLNWLVSLFSSSRIFVVGYHSIGSTGGSFREDLYPHLTISTDMFARHMAYLKGRGHTFMTMSQLLDPARRSTRKPTVIYFDDGFKNVMVNALPVLKQYGIPPTIFVTSGIVDLEHLPKFSNGKTATSAEVVDRYLTWDEIRMMRDGGAEFGAHGLTHAKMNECTPEALQRELEIPRRRITEELGETPNALAYPHGRFNRDVLSAARDAGYRIGVTSIEGWNDSASIVRAPFAVKKISPKPADDFRTFKVKVYGWNLLMRVTGTLRL